MDTSNSDENKNSNEPTRRVWETPKLVIEDTENTKGGNFSCNAVGDDAWYSS
jgi:hypothetical protein